MDRVITALIIAALTLLFLFLMYRSWRARSRRQSGLPTPTPVPTELGEPIVLVNALLLATTGSGDPLDRIAAHDLGFRAQCRIGVHPEGVVVDPTGSTPYLIPAAALSGVARGTWTIDRAVEPGGLVVLTWMLGEATLDSHLRIESGRDAALLDAVAALLPADERSTHDA